MTRVIQANQDVILPIYLDNVEGAGILSDVPEALISQTEYG
jgi:hypothetical protein